MESYYPTTRCQISKHELVVAYFPDLNYPAAQKKFERWINKNPFIMKELKKENYNVYQKKLSGKQLRIIFKFLGQP